MMTSGTEAPAAFELHFSDAKTRLSHELEERLTPHKAPLTKDELDAKLDAGAERAKARENEKLLMAYADVQHAREVHNRTLEENEIKALETGMALEGKEVEAAKRRQSLVDETRAKAHEHLEHVKAVHDAHQA